VELFQAYQGANVVLFFIESMNQTVSWEGPPDVFMLDTRLLFELRTLNFEHAL